MDRQTNLTTDGQQGSWGSDIQGKFNKCKIKVITKLKLSLRVGAVQEWWFTKYHHNGALNSKNGLPSHFSSFSNIIIVDFIKENSWEIRNLYIRDIRFVSFNARKNKECKRNAKKAFDERCYASTKVVQITG